MVGKRLPSQMCWLTIGAAIEQARAWIHDSNRGPARPPGGGQIGGGGTGDGGSGNGSGGLGGGSGGLGGGAGWGGCGSGGSGASAGPTGVEIDRTDDNSPPLGRSD